MEQIEEMVHRLYWEEDKNCARTMLAFAYQYVKGQAV